MSRVVISLLRSLRHSPASATAAVLTLALTLGAGTTIFAVVDAVLITPPPFANPDAVVTLGETPVASPGAARMISYPTFDAWRTRAASLATLAAFDGTNLTLTGLGPAERLSATDIAPEFLPLLGVTPVMGRLFTPDDVGQAVAIVSHDFWQGRLQADPAVIGRAIVLGGRAHTIVGVLPAVFAFPLNPSEVWRPLPLTSAQAARTTYRMRALARLAPNVTPATLATALDEISARASPASRAVVTPIATAIARGATATLRLLVVAAAIAVLMAFANLVGLLLVRSMDRAEELAIRVALGARPSVLAIRPVVEAEAIVLGGAAAGIVLATLLTPTVGVLVQQQFGTVANREVAVDWRVIMAVTIVSVACAALAGLLPAVLAAHRAAATSLRRGIGRPPRERALRRLLIVGQVALAFVLLVSMALLGRSLASLLDRHPGFEVNGLLTMRVSLPAARYAGDAQESGFYAALQRSLDERLGDGTAAVVDEIPLTGDGGRTLIGLTPDDARAEAVARVAGPSYFDVMRIPLLAGRGFDARDDALAPPRVIVSERLANRVFGARPAVGQRLWLAGPQQSFEVVGVAGDVAHRSLDDAPLETVYLAAWQRPSRSSHIVVRDDRAADALTVIRDEVAKLDRELPVYAVRPMTEVVNASAGVPALRVLTGTFAAFALLALALSGLGVFGIVAHDVASRRPELAVRLALGAHPTRLLGGVLRQGSMIIGAGVAVGLVLWFSSGQLLAALAPGIDRFDFTAVAMAAAVLLVVGLWAALPPARRAARTDPLAALRAE